MSDWIIGLIEKYGLPFEIVAMLIVPIHVIGWVDFDNLIIISGVAVPIAKIAVVCLFFSFLAGKIFRSLYPTLHPDIRCLDPKCNANNLPVIYGRVKCPKCGKTYPIGEGIKRPEALPENKPLE